MNEKEKFYRDNSKKFNDKVYFSAKEIAYKSQQAVKELELCEKREYLRAVDTAFKNAVLGIAAAAMDFYLEYKSWDKKKFKEDGWKKTLGAMDYLQLMQAPAGDTFSETLRDLFKSEKDVKRSCTKFMKMHADIQIKTCEMITWASIDRVWEIMADNLHEGSSALQDGNQVSFSELPDTGKADKVEECASPRFGGK